MFESIFIISISFYVGRNFQKWKISFWCYKSFIEIFHFCKALKIWKVIYKGQGTNLTLFLNLKNQGDEIPMTNEVKAHNTSNLESVSVRQDENYIIIEEKALTSIQKYWPLMRSCHSVHIWDCIINLYSLGMSWSLIFPSCDNGHHIFLVSSYEELKDFA